MKQSPPFLKSLAALFVDLQLMGDERQQARAITFCLNKLVNFAEDHAKIFEKETEH